MWERVASIGLGSIGTIFLGVVGQFVWRKVEASLNGASKLNYFFIEEDDARLPESDQEFWREVIYGSFASGFRDHRTALLAFDESMRLTRRRVSIVLQNVGKKSVKTVSVLVEVPPIFFASRPDIAIHRKQTADGRVELQIGEVLAGQQVRLVLYGVRSPDVKRVSFDGGKAEKLYVEQIFSERDVSNAVAKAEGRGNTFALLIALAWLVHLWLLRNYFPL